MLLAFQALGYKSVSSLSNVSMQMEDAVISVPARNNEIMKTKKQSLSL